MKLDKKKRSLNCSLEMIAYALLLILWGVTILFDSLPFGVGLVGSGMILLGLNATRTLIGIPTRGRTTVPGILALAWGGLELASLVFHLPSELSDWAIFAILLIVLGVILLGRELPCMRKPGIENLR